MRRWILVLMIALLPVRGWVGDAMASAMVSDRLVATNSIAAHADPMRSAASSDAQDVAPDHADCHGKAAMAASSEAPAQPTAATTQDGDACGSCTACQVCHTVAMAVPVVTVTPVLPHHATPPAMGQQFASAVPARGFKPPIS